MSFTFHVTPTAILAFREGADDLATEDELSEIVGRLNNQEDAREIVREIGNLYPGLNRRLQVVMAALGEPDYVPAELPDGSYSTKVL